MGQEVGIDLDQPRPDTVRRHDRVSFVATAATLFVLSLVYLGRAATSCSSTVLGAGANDGTMGGVWMSWAWHTTGGGPFHTTQLLTGGGLGDRLWQPVNIVSVGWSVLMWSATAVLGPVCGYNAMFVVGWVTAGLGMWALVRHVSPSRLVAAAAAVVYAFTSFTQMKAQAGHVGGLMIGLFPLLLLALLRLWEHPTARRAVVVGVCWGALAYVDGYYLGFGPVLVGGFVAAVLVSAWRLDRRRAWAWARPRLLASIGAAVVAMVVMVPFALTVLTNRDQIGRQRDADEAMIYAARISEYLLPPATSPLMPSGYRSWRVQNSHGSNEGETALYLGWVVLAGATTALVVERRRRRPGDGPSPDSLDAPMRPALGERRFAVAGAFGVALAGVLFSLPPRMHVLGVDVPLPSLFLRIPLPELRALSRLFVVVETGVVLIAALGLEAVLRALVGRHRGPAVRVAASVAVCGLCLTEALTSWPGDATTWSYHRIPASFTAIGDDPSVDMFASYPMSSRSPDEAASLVTYQPWIGVPMVNAMFDTAAADDASDVVRGLSRLQDPQTIPALRYLGVDVVLISGPERQALAPAEAEALGLEFVQRFTCGADAPTDRDCRDGSLYRLSDGPPAPAMLALGSGWGVYQSWSSSTLMSPVAQLTPVAAASDAGEVTVSFLIGAVVGAYELEVVDGDEVRASVAVTPAPTTVTFRAAVGRTLELRLTGADGVPVDDAFPVMVGEFAVAI
jgi:hypothetical protein